MGRICIIQIKLLKGFLPYQIDIQRLHKTSFTAMVFFRANGCFITKKYFALKLIKASCVILI